MEAAPRLPMISFELKTSTEPVSFGPKLKQYIAAFYHEEPESYNNEIHNLESLRSAAARPAIDVTGCQILKKYYCQLNFLKSRFPMEKGQSSAVSFSWKDLYAGLVCSVSDIDFELSSILYNIGALHTQLGASDSRSSSEGMKMSCTHFQCAAWTFQHLKDHFSQLVSLSLSPEVIHFMHHLCLAQAQECILEKSMMDNRKASIIAKVAVQVVEYYNQAISILNSGTEDGTMNEIVGSRVFKDWSRYLKFKVAYHSCVSLLYQGQQAEEAQKMGERVAYYQAASEQLEEARKIAKGNMGHQQHDIDEALGFTQDVVEGKKKAAKNENEFIYHEVVPEKDALQQVTGASLVKGIPFSVNDSEVSGPDLFQRLVPMEAHEASSVYSEQKAEMLRQIASIVDVKDSELAEFMSSLQLDCLSQYRQAVGVPQEVVDRAAAICAKPQATQALVEVMGKLAGTCHEVESVLGDIQEMIKEEEIKEQEYQKVMGSRPPGIVSTDLTREAGKYSEAHSKANESNQTLHRAMTMHMSNLKVLAQPLVELKKTIPCAVPNDPTIDEAAISELEQLLAKVDEMRGQRETLVAQLREAVCNDDITALLVTKPANLTMEQLFQKELAKHKRQGALIEQNLAAQENILQALTDVYARFAPTRRHIVDILKRREQTTTALIASYDAYDDLLAKANKGIEFYQKLEGNVTKLQQRVRSACRVNEEEREQMLAKSGASIPAPMVKANPSASLPTNTAPKLKDYLASMKAANAAVEPVSQWVPPSIRPTPLGSEETSDKRYDSHSGHYGAPTVPNPYTYPSTVLGPNDYYPTAQPTPNVAYNYPDPNTTYYQYNATQPQPQPQVPQTYTAPEYTPQLNQYQYNTEIKGQTYQPSTYNYPQQQVDTKNIAGIQSAYQPAPTPYISYPETSATANIPQNYPTTSSSSDLKLVSTYAGYAQFQNYQMPNVYYSNSDSYTPEVTPQQNFATPSSYAPSLNTKAPSQKLEQEYQHPSGCLSSANYYSAQNTYQTSQPAYSTAATTTPSGYVTGSAYYTGPEVATPAGYTSNVGATPGSYQNNYAGVTPGTYVPQPEVQYPSDPNYTAAAYPTGVTPATPYTYPTPDISIGYPNSTSTQYQAPSEEYQKQYQYIPQYYQSYPAAASTEPVPNTNAGQTYPTQPTTPSNSNSNPNQDYSSYYYSPYGHQTPGKNSMTTIQANTNVSAITPSASNTSVSSNVDLLAGLDFTINQTPLEPQVPVKPKIEEVSSNPVTPSISTTTVIIKSSETLMKQEEKQEEEQTEQEINEPVLEMEDPEVHANFCAEVEKMEKLVDSLTVKTLNGPTPLDIKWKEIQEQQERDAQKSSISVARCYPMKNRFPDIMPYDQFRVELPSTKDDYINASHVRSISKHCPHLIVTQAPLKSTIDDFWTMIWEQQVQVIVCLLGDSEMQTEASMYWPTERGNDLTVGRFRILLQGVNPRDHWIERIISVSDGVKHLVVVHLQFVSWPGGGLFPPTVVPLVSLAGAALACYRQQRVKARPLLVHCLSGVGRSGVLCLLMAAMCDPTTMLDVGAAANRISRSRKNILRDREHLKFAYQAVLQHFRDLISGKQLQSKIQNISIGAEETSSRRSSITSSDTTHVLDQKQKKKFTPEQFGALKEQGISSSTTDSSDPLSSLDPLWTMKKQ